MAYSTTPFAKRIEKPWGFEVIYTPDDLKHVGKIISVQAGRRLSLQYHDQKEETLCLVSGEALIWLENDLGEITKVPMETYRGYSVVVGQKHRLEAIKDSVIVEVSDPEKGNTFRLADDFERGHETEAVRGTAGRGWQPKD